MSWGPGQSPIANRVGYDDISGPAILLAPSNQQLMVREVACVNGTGAAMQVGIANSMNYTHAAIYTLQGGVATAVSPIVNANNGTYTAQGFTTTANDGLLIQGMIRFGMLYYSLNVAATGSPVFSYEYWNGSAWIAFTPIIDKGFSATGAGFMVFSPSYKWAKGTGGYAGLNANYYTIRLRATTASGTAGTLSQIQLSRVLTLRQTEALQALQMSFEIQELFLNQGEGIVPIFENQSPLHTVEYVYKNR
jgi:hypothetical protein